MYALQGHLQTFTFINMLTVSMYIVHPVIPLTLTPQTTKAVGGF